MDWTSEESESEKKAKGKFEKVMIKAMMTCEESECKRNAERMEILNKLSSRQDLTRKCKKSQNKGKLNKVITMDLPAVSSMNLQ